MDGKLIIDVLKVAGLPGVIVVGWMVAALAGKGENLVVWGGMTLAAVVINFLAFQLKSWQDTIVQTITQTVDSGNLNILHVMEGTTEILQRLSVVVSEMKSSHDGDLTLSQIKALLPRIFDALKWHTQLVCRGSLEGSLLTLVDRHGLQSATYVQVMSVIQGLAKYNAQLNNAGISREIHNALDRLFTVLYDPAFISNDNYPHRIRTLEESIRREFDICLSSIIRQLDILQGIDVDHHGSRLQSKSCAPCDRDSEHDQRY